MKNLPKARTSDLVISDYKDEILVYDLRSHRCHSLNRTAHTVWQEADGKKTLEQIGKKIDRRLSKLNGEQLVLLSLGELEKRDLLDSGTQYGFRSSVSRREIIKSVGKSTMIALPFIASITAPKAISAQSGCAPGQTCGSNCCDPGDACCTTGLPPFNTTQICCSTGVCGGPTGCCQAPCGTGCCPPGFGVCLNDQCCPPTRVCGANCCAVGETCAGGTCCGTGQQACGSTCCGPLETCVNGACCPTARACGGVCCPPSQICDPFQGCVFPV
ncbi:MAG: PqqD family protein [Pyrinomonadaceae bacterium]|nr:PqqD family protein [Pyrinomonadaceae bacterium]